MADAQRFQVFPLLWTAGCGKDLAAGALHDLNGGQPHAAGSGMNENSLARTEMSQMVECIIRGEESNRNGGSGFKADMFWFAHGQVRRRRHIAAKAVASQSDN
ncbi:MAG: hypothetical protein M3347_09930, partial [Armatimonadota bacterium]|nr:hypothetical protein [Armatimonadota bacterium]